MMTKEQFENLSESEKADLERRMALAAKAIDLANEINDELEKMKRQ